jgi:hypothetical protein
VVVGSSIAIILAELSAWPNTTGATEKVAGKVHVEVAVVLNMLPVAVVEACVVVA